jgi:ABC-type polysaccharide/polyol phosphate export permease
VIYPAATIPGAWRLILWLNPVACAILQIRETCVQEMALNLKLLAVLLGGSSALLLIAAGWFRSISRRFADVL